MEVRAGNLRRWDGSGQGARGRTQSYDPESASRRQLPCMHCGAQSGAKKIYFGSHYILSVYLIDILCASPLVTLWARPLGLISSRSPRFLHVRPLSSCSAGSLSSLARLACPTPRSPILAGLPTIPSAVFPGSPLRWPASSLACLSVQPCLRSPVSSLGGVLAHPSSLVRLFTGSASPRPSPHSPVFAEPPPRRVARPVSSLARLLGGSLGPYPCSLAGLLALSPASSLACRSPHCLGGLLARSRGSSPQFGSPVSLLTCWSRRQVSELGGGERGGGRRRARAASEGGCGERGRWRASEWLGWQTRRRAAASDGGDGRPSG